MFLGIILKVLRLEVSVYNVYIPNQFQTTFTRGVGGMGRGVNLLVEVTVNSKEENKRLWSQLRPRIRPLAWLEAEGNFSEVGVARLMGSV